MSIPMDREVPDDPKEFYGWQLRSILLMNANAAIVTMVLGGIILLFRGWDSTYPAGTVISTAALCFGSGLALRNGIRTRASRRWVALAIRDIGFVVLPTALILNSEFPQIQMTNWFMFVFFFTAAILGYCITSVEGLVDFAVLTVVGYILPRVASELGITAGNKADDDFIAGIFMILLASVVFRKGGDELLEIPFAGPIFGFLLEKGFNFDSNSMPLWPVLLAASLLVVIRIVFVFSGKSQATKKRVFEAFLLLSIMIVAIIFMIR